MFGLRSTSLFGETKKLEREIDEFVDILSEVGLVFKSIIPTYLNNSANGKFNEMTIVAENSPLISSFIIKKTSQFYKILS